MAYTLVPTELIVDGAITSAKLDTNIAISGTLGVTGEVTLATHLIMGDNDKIKIGTGGDLEIYHDGSNSYISNSTGNLYLGDTNGSVHIQAKLNEESIICTADGAVTLYYDNSSKLATTSTGIDVTGTATVDVLTVDGNATYLASLNNTAQDARIQLSRGGTEFGQVSAGGNLMNLVASGSSTDMRFLTNSAERMRIDTSGNVGIGQTSPKTTLNVAANNSGQGAILTLENSDTSITTNDVIGQIDFYANDGSTNGTGAKVNIKGIAASGAGTNTALTFGTSDSTSATAIERMRINSSGNVGIGQTSPDTLLELSKAAGTGTSLAKLANTSSAATSNISQIDFELSNTFSGANVDVQIGAVKTNAGNEESAFYINTTSGTGTPTERMRIRSDGGVGINSSGYAGQPLTVNAGSGDYVFYGESTDAICKASFRDNSSTANIEFGASGNNHIFSKDGATQMTIDSSGNVGIGVSPSSEFHVKGDANTIARIEPNNNSGKATLLLSSTGSGDGGIQYDANNNQTHLFSYSDMTFNVGTGNLSGSYPANERMRIDSSGRLLVGTAAGSFGARITAESTTSYTFESRRTGTGNEGHIVFKNANGAVGTIFTNGSTTAYNTSSDYRLKENIIEITGAIDRVNQLQPKRFNFIADADTTVDGFLAHEVQDIIPEAVTGEKDAVDDEGNPHYQGIDQSKLVPLLTKAIQEQQTIIDDLKSRIETLEG